MTGQASLEAAVFEALASVAPEVDPAMLRRDQALRDQIDLDSMDYLRFVVALHDRLGVDVPESDYPQLGTLDGIIRYLTTRRARVGV